jgi:hypothetical protein
VTEKYGNFLDSHTGYQRFHGKGVAEHVRMAPFGPSVGLAQVRNKKKLSIRALPVSHG